MTVTLQAQKRIVGQPKAHLLRAERKIPAVIYGGEGVSESLTLGEREFTHLYHTAGESTLIDVSIEGKTPVKALIHDVAYNPLSGAIDHVDLYRVTMTKKINAEIPLVFIGEAPGIKELGGILVKNLQKIKVMCLPADLIASLEVDCTSLHTFNDFVYVRDLHVPAAMTVLEQPGEIVVTLTPPREEEIAPAAVEEKDKVAEVEVVGKKEKKEGEEGEEGEAAAPEKKGEKKEKKK